MIKKEFARREHLAILGEDSDVYISLKCGETERWEEEQLWDKWLGVVEHEVYREVYNCADIRKMKML